MSVRACLHEHATATAYVSLMADGEATRLYERFGFECAEAPASTGMFMRIC